MTFLDKNSSPLQENNEKARLAGVLTADGNYNVQQIQVKVDSRGGNKHLERRKTFLKETDQSNGMHKAAAYNLPKYMRPSLVLRTAAVRLTLFTRANCGLCDVAKSRIAEVQKKRSIDYQEVDIMSPGQEKWKDVYDFDVPVLHVDKATTSPPGPTLDTAKKLMHRFTVEEVEKAVDEVEQH
ncbi:hypothetical protein ABEF95_000354 [Exophiala dermatitidis]